MVDALSSCPVDTLTHTVNSFQTCFDKYGLPDTEAGVRGRHREKRQMSVFWSKNSREDHSRRHFMCKESGEREHWAALGAYRNPSSAGSSEDQVD